MLGDVDGAVEVEALADEDDMLNIEGGAQVFNAGVGVDAMGVDLDGQGWDAGFKKIVAHGGDFALCCVFAAADDDVFGGTVFIKGDGGVETLG